MANIRTIIIALFACLLSASSMAQGFTQSELGWRMAFVNFVGPNPSAPTNLVPRILNKIVTATADVLQTNTVSWAASSGTAPIEYFVYGATTNPFNLNAGTFLGPTAATSFTNNFDLSSYTNYFFTIISSNSVATSTSSVQLTQCIPVMTDNTHPTGIASATQEAVLAPNGFQYGVNGSAVPFWHGDDKTVPQELDYTFGAGNITTNPIVTSYAMLLDQGVPGPNVAAFTLDGWNGSAWVTLDTETVNTTNNYDFVFWTTNTAIRCQEYRINFTTFTASVATFVGTRLQLFGIP